MLLIGLTGGIGSGKSTAAEKFKALGVPVIDADEIAHQLLQSGTTAFKRVLKVFGPSIIDTNGDIDRAKLREWVFTDPRRRIELEGILHPLIRKVMLESAHQQSGPYVILMVPLLVETGQIDLVEKIVVVEIPEHLQIQRTMGRDELSVAEVEVVLKAQADTQTRRAVADYVIDNGEDLKFLQQQVKALHQQFLELASADGYRQVNQVESIPQPSVSQRFATKAVVTRRPPSKSTSSSSQTSEVTKAVVTAADVIYELPLHERIRGFIRLENLFDEIAYYAKGNNVYDSRAAVHGILALLQIFSRPDVKNDLLKEVERLMSTLNRYVEVSGVDTNYLREVLAELSESSKGLYHREGQFAQQLRQNELINAIKQRDNVPGGTFSVDLPFYGHWLMQDVAQRQQDIQAWLSHFVFVKKSAQLILALIRESAAPTRQIAHTGYYQQTMDTNLPYQLVRIVLPQGSSIYPEISGGRHRFSVRFLKTMDVEKPTQVDDEVEFKLACCAL